MDATVESFSLLPRDDPNSNRVHQQTWFGKTIVEVCRKPWQFSCWNEKDPNYKVVTQKTLSDNLFTFCKKVANGLIYKDWPDLTKGSDHYHSSLLPILPKWTVHQTAQIQIGRHIFYKLEVK